MEYPTPEVAFTMLMNANMRPFTPNDWSAFAGCETPSPFIGTTGPYVIVLDGAKLFLLKEGDDGEGCTYELSAVLNAVWAGLFEGAMIAQKLRAAALAHEAAERTTDPNTARMWRNYASALSREASHLLRAAVH